MAVTAKVRHDYCQTIDGHRLNVHVDNHAGAITGYTKLGSSDHGAQERGADASASLSTIFR